MRPAEEIAQWIEVTHGIFERHTGEHPRLPRGVGSRLFTILNGVPDPDAIRPACNKGVAIPGIQAQWTDRNVELYIAKQDQVSDFALSLSPPHEEGKTWAPLFQVAGQHALSPNFDRVHLMGDLALAPAEIDGKSQESWWKELYEGPNLQADESVVGLSALEQMNLRIKDPSLKVQSTLHATTTEFWRFIADSRHPEVLKLLVTQEVYPQSAHSPREVTTPTASRRVEIAVPHILTLGRVQQMFAEELRTALL